MAEYIGRDATIKAFEEADYDVFTQNSDDGFSFHTVIRILNEMPTADVIERNEGIRIGAELAAMHGSDATSQEKEHEYWRGFEDGHQRMASELMQCRNELCLRCGAYKNRHLGACDDCRWKDIWE